jgi:hypothetical protein
MHFVREAKDASSGKAVLRTGGTNVDLHKTRTRRHGRDVMQGGKIGDGHGHVSGR